RGDLHQRLVSEHPRRARGGPPPADAHLRDHRLRRGAPARARVAGSPIHRAWRLHPAAPGGPRDDLPPAAGGGRRAMRYVEEYRSPELARRLAEQIVELVEPGRRYKFMEVCGGHTHTIYKHGIEDLLPPEVELVHGPGCPVCVIPMGRQDDALAIAERPEVIFTTFGDMLRVPGSHGSLLDAKARGADVRMVYSPLDALKLARTNPEREVVFFAIGFETTAPSTALTLLRAREEGIGNFSVFCNHVTIIPG